MVGGVSPVVGGGSPVVGGGSPMVGGGSPVVGVQNLVGANGRSPLPITDKG